MRRSRSLLVAACLAGLAACGGGAEPGTAEPVVIGSIPPGTGAPIERDTESIDDTGLVEVGRWPSACSLVDEDVVSALFPEAVGVERHPEARTLTLLVLGGEDRVVTVPEGDCTIRVGLPQEGLALDDDSGGVRFLTSVIAVGDEEMVARVAGDPGGEPVDIAGDDACLLTAPHQVTCNRGTFAFQVGLDLRSHGQYVHSSESPYEMSGTTVVYDAGSERDEFVREQVLLPVVASVLARDV